MNSDERLREAFDDLARRAGSVEPRPIYQRLPAPNRRWVWALAGAVIVSAAIGVVAIFDLLAGTTDDDIPVSDTTSTTVSVPEVPGPSQSPEDAARDGVVPALAELPIAERVAIVASESAAEGVWVLSEVPATTAPDDCVIGDRSGVYGEDYICAFEYDEVLLLSEDAGEILRAYPLPGVPAQHLLVTPDAVFCGRQGDGGLPDSMLCRIDRSSLELTGRIFPFDEQPVYGPEAQPIPPGDWTIEEPDGLVVLETMEFVDGQIATTGQDGRAFHDPVTLERVGFEPAAADRFRVDTERVRADTADPFLNVRWEPGASSDLLAKLPPTYSGLRWTGDQETTPDGATWYQVELADPVTVDPPEPLEGRNPVGWVNASYLVPLPEGLPVTASEIPPCTGDGTTPFGGTSDAYLHVYSLESARLSDSCVRIVVGFGTGPAPVDFIDVDPDVRPADTVPRFLEAQGPWPLIVDFPDTTTAWPGSVDLPGVYMVRSTEGGLSLLVLQPAAETFVHTIPERGLLVIDLRGGDQTVPPEGANIALTTNSIVRSGGIDVTGIARPFEATLGVKILDASGNPVQAAYSGSSFLGTVRTDAYAVMTNDWLDAWGRFAVRADGLAPGNYLLVLDAEGGADRPRTLDVQFTIIESGETPATPGDDANRIADALVAFAQGAPEPPELAATVLLRLGNAVSTSRTRTQLADPSNWVVDAEDFNGWSGPFDILGIAAQRPHVRISEGPIPHCASPSIDWWPGADLVLPQINLEPIGIDSCLQWYAVTLRVDSAGVIQEVVLDLWEP